MSGRKSVKSESERFTDDVSDEEVMEMLGSIAMIMEGVLEEAGAIKAREEFFA